MTAIRPVLLLAFASAFAPPTAAARDEPLRNPSGIQVAWNRPDQPTLVLIERAIISACAVRGWQCRATGPGEVRAVLMVRQHMAETVIVFDTEKYSVTYVNSAQLRYDSSRNTIHRKYNAWVANLIGDINQSIAALP